MRAATTMEAGLQVAEPVLACHLPARVVWAADVYGARSTGSEPGLRPRGSRLHGGADGRGQRLLRDAVLLAEQPAVDDVPFVPPPGLEIQKVGFAVLQFKKEFQRVPAGSVVGVDRLRPQPAIPLLGNQYFRFFLLHLSAPQLWALAGPGSRAGLCRTGTKEQGHPPPLALRALNS